MTDEQKAREDEVFDQEISLDDLDAAAAGGSIIYDSDWDASTVEDGSFCNTNDACWSQAIDYKGIKGNQSDKCEKAWH